MGSENYKKVKYFCAGLAGGVVIGHAIGWSRGSEIGKAVREVMRDIRFMSPKKLMPAVQSAVYNVVTQIQDGSTTDVNELIENELDWIQLASMLTSPTFPIDGDEGSDQE